MKPGKQEKEWTDRRLKTTELVLKSQLALKGLLRISTLHLVLPIEVVICDD